MKSDKRRENLAQEPVGFYREAVRELSPGWRLGGTLGIAPKPVKP
jgi:hypothetical protein